MRTLSVLFTLFIASPMLSAQGASGDPPTQQVLKVDSENLWGLTQQVLKPVYKTVQYTYTVNVPVTVKKQVPVDGVIEEKEFTEIRPEMKTATRTVCEFVPVVVCAVASPDTVKAFETDGRAISPSAVAKRCQEPTLVVVSANGEMIPAHYAAVFKPGTVILALPPQPAPLHEGLPTPAPVQAPTPAPVPVIAPPAAAVPRDLSRFQLVSQPIELPQPPVVNNGRVLPNAPAPNFVSLSRDGDQFLNLRNYAESDSDVEVTVKYGDSSIAREKVIKARQSVKHSDTIRVPWEAVRLSQPERGDISAERAKEQLKAESTVGLMSFDGGLVDVFWLQNIKPSVFVVRGIKTPAAGMGNRPMPGPAAPPMPHPAAAPQPVPAAPATPVEAPQA